MTAILDSDLREDAHSLEQALLGSILATVPDALIVIDVQGRIRSWKCSARCAIAAYCCR
jgi:two-component system sensor kinase FixL